MCYKEDSFVVFDFKNGYIVYNKKKPFSQGHSHLRNFKPCKDAILFVLQKKIPKRTSFYYLRTLQRLSADKRYIDKIQQLIDVRKQKGRKQRYFNAPAF